MIHSASGKIEKVVLVYHSTSSLAEIPSVGNDWPFLHETIQSFRKRGVKVCIAADFTSELFSEYERTEVEKRRPLFKGFIPIKNPSLLGAALIKLAAQDLFEFTMGEPLRSLIYKEDVPYFFNELSRSFFSEEIQIKFDAKFPDGGNLLFGGLKEVKYLVATVPDKLEYEAFENSLLEYYPTIKHCILLSLFPDELHSAFYHTDLYVMIGGIIPKLDKTKETVFIAKYFSNDRQTVESAELWIEGTRDAITRFSNDNQFPIFLSHLPVYIVVPDEGKPYTLSYVNCHVENYVRKGHRKVRISFPGFKKTASKYLKLDGAEAFNQEDITEKRKRHVAWGKLMNRIIPEYRNKESQEMFARRTFFSQEEVEEDIAEIERQLFCRMKKLNIEALFINDDFYELGMNYHGTLHCVSKVISRSN